MDASAIDRLRLLGEEGPRRFSRWDPALFNAYSRMLLATMWADSSPRNGRTFAGLSELVQQGVGAGYLKGDPEDAPANFFEFCIKELLPEILPGLPDEEHLPFLARVWNLGEGLLREPEWVNGYVMSRIDEFRGDDRPEAILEEILRPLLEPAPSARWQPPYRVSLLSLRPADDEFLPGEMQLAAPAVLVVSDRRRPVRLGIHLRREGRSAVVGRLGPNAAFPEESPAVGVAWDHGRARIGDDEVSLPFLALPYRWALVRAGYLVASATDSQKLWIVESAS